jgi:hypothetical protein
MELEDVREAILGRVAAEDQRGWQLLEPGAEREADLADDPVAHERAHVRFYAVPGVSDVTGGAHMVLMIRLPIWFSLTVERNAVLIIPGRSRRWALASLVGMLETAHGRPSRPSSTVGSDVVYSGRHTSARTAPRVPLG